MIGIINYGLGNVSAFYNLYKENNINLKIINKPSDITTNTKKILLPGVGSFDQAVKFLKIKNFTNILKEFVSYENNMLLGICIGMHILFSSSEEGNEIGFGFFEGSIKKISSNVLPHVGWNNIKIIKNSDLVKNVLHNDMFYFLHSYSFANLNNENINALTRYNSFDIASIVTKKNIFGVQFHPEKSHDSGKKILLNFYNL